MLKALSTAAVLAHMVGLILAASVVQVIGKTYRRARSKV